MLIEHLSSENQCTHYTYVSAILRVTSSLQLQLLTADASICVPVAFLPSLIPGQSTINLARKCILQEVFAAATQIPCQPGASGIAAKSVRPVCKLRKSVNTDFHDHPCPTHMPQCCRLPRLPMHSFNLNCKRKCFSVATTATTGCHYSSMQHFHAGWVRRGGEAGPSGRSGVTPRRTGAWISGSNSKHACTLILFMPGS